MRFCPKCGNKLINEQHFCNRCGYDLHLFEDISESVQYEPPTHKTRIWPFVLVGLVVIGVIVSCCFAYYHFFLKETEQPKQTATTATHVKKEKATTDEDKVSNDPVKAEKQKAKQRENEKHKVTDTTQLQGPKIDVMSEDFHRSFMQKDTRDAYMGIKLGMTRAKVEKRYGISNRVFHKKGMDYLYTIYGNLAVAYELKGNTEVVREIGVSPSNVDERTFISKYSDYEEKNDAGVYIYNTVKNNGFEILVDTENGKIALIQCIPENHD
ncbi:zinc ribbon domain-containing protein [Staphylococcus borealis]|uniref:zinc ribbon domain-containing protein n=1 Tax=Staphylococcus borealis TaxID=2742203 RepID=UPI002A80EFCE|nr:zinc ribbon domain-containing protein [Staphylococcus borealis]MDY4023039.1 zinc ribbon domain-containing protein [Staphylococcus borealis]